MLQFEAGGGFCDAFDAADSRKALISQLFEGLNFDSDDQVVVATNGVHLLNPMNAGQGLLTTSGMVTNDVNENKRAYRHDVPPMLLLINIIVSTLTGARFSSQERCLTKRM